MDSFRRIFRVSEDQELVSLRVESLSEALTYSVHTSVAQALLDKDRFLWTFLVCSHLYMSDGALSQSEWSFFLRVGADVTVGTQATSRPSPEWMGREAWATLASLTACCLEWSELLDSIIKEGDAWNAFFQSEAPLNVSPPEPFQRLSPFRKLLLVRIVTPGTMVPAAHALVALRLGERYLKIPRSDLRTAYTESTMCTPLVLMLPTSSAADPFLELVRFPIIFSGVCAFVSLVINSRALVCCRSVSPRSLALAHAGPPCRSERARHAGARFL
jgi:dynein heavy chain